MDGSNDFDISHINRLVVISYNLHGLNQGAVGIIETIEKLVPSIILIQEHWLTSDNMSKLTEISDQYLVFGSSAMEECVQSGPIIGRPFGGTASLVHKSLVAVTKNVFCSDRCTVIKIADWLIVNVYMPSYGVGDRLLLYSNILCELEVIMLNHNDCNWLIGGDFNANLDLIDSLSRTVNKFIIANELLRCDLLFPVASKHTYVNDALNSSSTIDYFLTSNSAKSVAFNIVDLDVNLSDDLPLITVCLCKAIAQADVKYCVTVNACTFFCCTTKQPR